MRKAIGHEEALQLINDHWLPEQAEAGLPIKELCRRHGFSEASYYLLAQQIWRYERPRCQATQRTRSRKWTLEKTARGVATRNGGHSRGAEKKVVSAPASRDVVRFMVSRGLSERRALRIIRMSASALRYQRMPDRNQGLRERILALAHRHRRYGAGMIYLKLRQAGEPVNHKRMSACMPKLACR